MSFRPSVKFQIQCLSLLICIHSSVFICYITRKFTSDVDVNVPFVTFQLSVFLALFFISRQKTNSSRVDRNANDQLRTGESHFRLMAMIFEATRPQCLPAGFKSLLHIFWVFFSTYKVSQQPKGRSDKI